MNAQTKIETIAANDIANTAFQVLTIAMVGLFSLAQTISFIAANMV